MSESHLKETDVREIVRLLSEVAVVDDDLWGKKRFLMEGLQVLIDADGWLWSLTRVDARTKTPICSGLLHGGLTQQQLTGWLEASQSSCPPPEDEPMFVISRAGKHFTRTRQQLVPDDRWYAHRAVERHRLRQGIDHFVYSVYPLSEPEAFSAIGLFRRVGREPFGEREAAISHILLGEVDWLHSDKLLEECGRTMPHLSRRQRIVAIMLIEAHSSAEIARLLHISLHTVRDHMKVIYKHFGVTSQLELIRRFRFGDTNESIGGSLV